MLYLAGDMVTPTGDELSVTERVTAPAVSTGITTFGPTTLTLSLSSKHPRSTPAGQAWTSGPPSGRDAGSTVRQERNHTGQGMEVPNVTPNLGTSHRRTRGMTSSVSWAPGPTDGSSQGTTNAPLHTTRESQGYVTKDPPFLTARTTGYVVWHPSPTGETPLNTTRLQNEESRPSSFPGPPSAPTAVTPETPTCGESSGDRDPSWNFRLARNGGRTFSSRIYMKVDSDIGQCGPPWQRVSDLVREKKGSLFIPWLLSLFTSYEPLAFNS